MGTLEEMRDLIRELVDDGEDLALFDELAMEWHNAGCPGYEPAPWGKDVPTEPGVYAVADDFEMDYYNLDSDGMWHFGDATFTSNFFHEGHRFRFLAPIPTPPEDV